jgi:hypothetical protein
MNNYQVQKTLILGPNLITSIHDVNKCMGNQHEQNAKDFIGWMGTDLWEQIPMFLAHLQANEFLFAMQPF